MNTPPPRCLLVDDDKAIRMLARLQLDDVGGEVIEAADAEHARSLLADSRPFEMVVADHRLPSDESGMDLLHRAAAQSSGTTLFIMSAHLSPDATREATAAGIGMIDKIDLEPLIEAWRVIVTGAPAG